MKTIPNEIKEEKELTNKIYKVIRRK